MNAEAVKLLKLKLAKLHALRIVHLDEPDNISFSPALNEAVFIDFGFSDVLEEAIGTKTLTSFVGTLNYSSP
jgi:serine/threonine protein kinase